MIDPPWRSENIVKPNEIVAINRSNYKINDSAANEGTVVSNTDDNSLNNKDSLSENTLDKVDLLNDKQDKNIKQSEENIKQQENTTDHKSLFYKFRLWLSNKIKPG